MSVLTHASASFVSDETISVLAFDQFRMAEMQMGNLYSQRGSIKHDEDHGSMAGFTNFTAKTPQSEPDEDSPVQQFRKQFIHSEFGKQSKVDRTVIDDSRFEFFARFGPLLGQSALRTFEEYAAKTFINSFTGADGGLCEDGLSLCNDAHVNADSGNSQDNKGSSALSHSTVSSTRISMRKFTDYRGNRIAVRPDLLIVPDDLEQTAFEIVRSSGDPTSSNLKANFHNGRFGAVVWGELTSTTDWWMADSMMMMANLLWYWRIPLEIFGDGSLMKGTRSIGGYYRSSFGALDWRWVYGHDV